VDCVLSDHLVCYIIDISFNYICVTCLYGFKNFSLPLPATPTPTNHQHSQDRVDQIVDLRQQTLNHRYD
jgi:hypothetical protein